MDVFAIDAWISCTALCGAALATLGLVYGRLTVLTIGSAIVVGAMMPMLDGSAYAF